MALLLGATHALMVVICVLLATKTNYSSWSDNPVLPAPLTLVLERPPP